MWSILTPRSFWSFLSQILKEPIFAHTLLYLYRDISKWHLSWFSFMYLHSNHSIAKTESCSNFEIKFRKSESHAQNTNKKKQRFFTTGSYFYFSNHSNWYNKSLLKKCFIINFVRIPTKYQMELKVSFENVWNNYLTRFSRFNGKIIV